MPATQLCDYKRNTLQGHVNRRRSSHPITEFCFFLNVIFASGDRDPSPYECSLTRGGVTYLGSLNITHSGKVCQKWSDNLPHQINSFITDRMFPDGSKETAQNYCRNPNVKSGVWCYTMDVDVEWEYCNTCPDNFEGYSACSLKDSGADYRGIIAHTQSYTQCQPWTNYPNVDFVFPDKSAGAAKNYCRNPQPNSYHGPWCYIAGEPGVTWEYCDVCQPFQAQVTKLKGGFSVDSSRMDDMSALACVRWCVTMGTCMGVIVGRKECWLLTRLDQQRVEDDNWNQYSVQRVCTPKTEGKSAFFVYFTNVQNDKPPFHEIKGSEEACEIECILRTLCSTFNRIRADGTCKFYNKIVFPRQQSYPDVDSRFIIRCLPSLRPTTDVIAPIEAETDIHSIQQPAMPEQTSAVIANTALTTAPEEEKKGLPIIPIVIVAVLIIIIVLGVGAYAHFKLGYFKGKEPGKAEGKDTVKVEEKDKEDRVISVSKLKGLQQSKHKKDSSQRGSKVDTSKPASQQRLIPTKSPSGATKEMASKQSLSAIRRSIQELQKLISTKSIPNNQVTTSYTNIPLVQNSPSTERRTMGSNTAVTNEMDGAVTSHVSISFVKQT